MLSCIPLMMLSCLLGSKKDIEEATILHITTEELSSFLKKSVETFIQELKSNINSRFSSQNIVAAFNIF